MSVRTFTLISLCAALAFSSCVPAGAPPAAGETHQAAVHLQDAGATSLPAEQRAALYLSSAAEAQALLGSHPSGAAARQIYNKAAADLTVLLRDADQGRRWDRPQTLSTGGTRYRLHFATGTRAGVWDPGYFTSFTPAAAVKLKTIERRNLQDGIGGALVGVHQTTPLAPFSPLVGVTAPVTTVLDFNGRDVTLTLRDPSAKPTARVAGADRALAADFSAPLAYYPQKSEFWQGLMGALRVEEFMKTTGLYMLQPYDPKRIPLIFIHGLISTPRMWRRVINEIESDPTLRGHYQCWVFSYPTGNPPTYSAMRLRDELAKVRQLYPQTPSYVLVGHSMGGLLARMQVATVTRESWDVVGKQRARQLFAKVKKGSLLDRCATFEANPKVARVIFICTPHRGSAMAIGSLGELAMRLISLPVDITSTITSTLGNSLAAVTGDPKRMPNSVSGLAPENPMLKVLAARPIEATHHSIIGDRGRGDTPHSSDGVVEYWSSHLTTAKSERIVPGPHGACELPETIAELRRLLHLQLQANGINAPAVEWSLGRGRPHRAGAP